MNLFTEILPGVREILSNASDSQVEAVLGLLLEERVLSKEYHQTLLHEEDRDDLARKVSLNLVEKWAVCWNAAPLPHGLQACGGRLGDAAASALPAKTTSLTDNAMESGPLPGRSCLDLLQSNADSWVLYQQHLEEEAGFCTDQPGDAVGYDQDNNPDVFYTVESDESGEELCLCSNAGEAYNKIEALIQYVLKDQQEGPEEDLFGSLVSDEAAAEHPGGCLESKKQRKCSSRKRSGSCSETPEPKRRQVAHSPALCVVSGNPATVPLSCSPAGAVSRSNFHVQFSMATLGPAGRPPKAFGSSVLPSAGWCFPVGTKDVQVIVTFAPLPLHVDLPVGPGAPSTDVRPGESAIAKEPEIPPFSSEQVHQRPSVCSRRESVDAFQKRRKAHFKDAFGSALTKRELPVEQLYVAADLAQCPFESRAAKGADQRACSLREKEEVRVGRAQIFQTAERSEPGSRVIVVLGKAGMGKSLLARKICLDWSGGQLAEYSFVFWFDCRRLSLLHEKSHTLKQLLFELSVGPREGGGGGGDDHVYRHILRNPDKTLLIFDGFDELKDQGGLMPSPGSPPRREPAGLGGILAGLFQKKVLNGCTLLLLARPRDKLHQCLPRVDKVLELLGFSARQAESYLARYFDGSPRCGEAVDLIQSCPYLFSHCHNPGLCRFICDSVFETGGVKLPPTLTSLFVRLLLQTLAPPTKDEAPAHHRHISALARVAWTLGQSLPNVLLSRHFPSLETKEFALQQGLMVPFPFLDSPGGGEEECGYTFSSSVVQNFLVALHLVLAKEIKDKKLTKHLRLLSKSKKFLSSWDLVPHFLAGLLFLPDELASSFLFGEDGELDAGTMIAKKRKNLFKYIRRLAIGDLCPDKLLELFHCINETQDQYLLQHVALEVRPALSFSGLPLTPPDVYALHSVLSRSTREFALDLRGSVDSDGLRQLVGIETVTSFRASLGDAVQLWKHLWEAKEEAQLRSAIQKFVVVPFKAKTMKDIDSLSALVHMKEEMSRGKADSAGSAIHVIPAVTELRQLEFALGPSCGLKGFKRLLEILDAFPALQHLDLDSPEENEIGDEGVAGLCDVLPRLASLETLNLSRNKITDWGAERLAGALPSLPSLKTLSLYNNNIGDVGAEKIAKMLPQMASLRVLDVQCNKIMAVGAQHLTDSLRTCPRVQSVALWNPTIPYGVLEHLQQLDSRIRSL